MPAHLFGPVPSRRLGMSLGVDMVPHKVCSFNCVYCECGKTTVHTSERKEYVPVDEVITELKEFLRENPAPDYITFSGAGEPTLNSRIGEVIKFIKEDYPDIPLAVLTNGSLLSDENVRQEIMPADLVLPSLDAASTKAFRKIDRPHPGIRLEEYIEGLVKFTEEFKGQVWLEVMIIPGYNDKVEDLMLLRDALIRINPDRIQLNTLDRPGTKADLEAASLDNLNEIIEMWGLENVEIIARPPERKEKKSYRKDHENAIRETIERRPCTVEDIADILGLHVNEVNKYLSVLEEEGKIEPVRLSRGIFYKLTMNNE